ncbi:MAG: tRNA pseudouridine(38-40) synthase TruA [Candidatus Kapaibacterium sp.]
MKFKIYLEYNGTNYAGWQQQKNAKTVQGSLIDAVRTIFSKSKGESRFIDLQGSGRTDRGVHAREQVAHLECETMLGPEIIKMKLNDVLPSDINILEVEKTHNRFHARHSAEARQYVYVISKRRTAFEKRYVWWVKDKLNAGKMSVASKLFIGMHDYRSFCEKSEDDKSTKVKVEDVSVTEDADKIYIRIKSSHFLWKMVRRLVGVLVEVGRGNMNDDDITRYLQNYTDELAKYTAPPSGLFLEKVYY